MSIRLPKSVSWTPLLVALALVAVSPTPTPAYARGSLYDCVATRLNNAIYSSEEKVLQIAEINQEITGLQGKLELQLQDLRELRHVGHGHDAVLRIKNEIEKTYSQLRAAYNQRHRLGKGYAVTEMDSRYIGESAALSHDLSHVRVDVAYFPKSRTEGYKVTVQEGRLHYPDGSRVNTSGDKHLFVMNADGEIFVLSDKYQRVEGDLKKRHSSFLAGQPVAAAGEVMIRDGQVLLITRRSGHYSPTEGFQEQVLLELQKQGADVTGVKMESGY